MIERNRSFYRKSLFKRSFSFFIDIIWYNIIIPIFCYWSINEGGGALNIYS
nr:MAG TPA: hypothetical protein [Caudoviricetes sp.]